MCECRTKARSPMPDGRAGPVAAGDPPPLPVAKASSGVVPPTAPPARPSGMVDREEIQCLIEICGAQPEVGGGNRRGEAVVEALGQAEPFVDAVPAELDRDLVGAQLAGVEEPE